jgi:hypothetical protein
MSPPYSADPIFQTVRFCNVHREDDKVTKWIRKYWNKADDPAWKFVLGRMLNLPESLAYLVLGQFERGGLTDAKILLKDWRAKGHKVFTSAYTISTCGKPMDKIDYVFDVVNEVRQVEETAPIDWPLVVSDCEWMYKELTYIDGLGSFLSAQVIADMKNTTGHHLETAHDWWTFVAPGPGSIKGLQAYFGDRVTHTTFKSFFDRCRVEVDPLIPEYIPKISNQDFQNCLCEFSKYMRVKLTNGHVRNRYTANS